MDNREKTKMNPPRWSFDRPADDTLSIRLEGTWSIEQSLPSYVEVEKALEAEPETHRLAFNTETLERWDSGLLTFLIKVQEFCSCRGITTEPGGLPEGVRRLLRLAAAVPERKGAARKQARPSFLARIGTAAVAFGASAAAIVEFIGEAAPVDYQVWVEVIRFDAGPEGDATLTARWSLYRQAEKKLLVTKSFTRFEAAGAPGYEARVSAGSRAVAALTREIAAAIRAAQ